jgi:hypothetical protein
VGYGSSGDRISPSQMFAGVAEAGRAVPPWCGVLVGVDGPRKRSPSRAKSPSSTVLTAQPTTTYSKH